MELNRYQSNLALFNASVRSGNRESFVKQVLVHEQTEGDEAQSCAEYATKKERRRRRRHRLHNHRFSDRSDGSENETSDVDSDQEMDSRGRTLLRVGDVRTQDCASGSRVICSPRVIDSDESDEDVPASIRAEVDKSVQLEVERFKELMAQLHAQEALTIKQNQEDYRVELCDDEESEDEGYESESDFDDEFDQCEGENRTSLSSAASSNSSFIHCHKLQQTTRHFYTVNNFSSNSDPGKVVRVL
ncbi:hypothetical protein V1512DRAFT_262535 [Lipomyces arxii]|uniref:uncharacterized protein n=1 Tax=Lipomyces arxii TaxID=56418 RepID=UPI0034CDF0C5